VARRIVSLTADLLFSSSIEATLTRQGDEVMTVEDVNSLERALRTREVDLVILDLHAGAEAGAVVMLCRRWACRSWPSAATRRPPSCAPPGRSAARTPCRGRLS